MPTPIAERHLPTLQKMLGVPQKLVGGNYGLPFDDIPYEKNTEFGRYVEQYLNMVAVKASRTTVRLYRKHCRVFGDWLGHRPLNSTICQLYVDEMISKGKGVGGILMQMLSLRRYANWRHNHAIDAQRWVVRPRLPDYVRKVKRPVREEEYEFLRSKIVDWPYNYLLDLLWETGLRISDAAMLKWDQIDMENRLIRFIPFKTRRTGKEVELPFRQQLYDWFIKIKAEHIPVLATGHVVPQLARGYLKEDGYLPYNFNKHLRKKGIRGLSCHSFRHGFITRLLERGVVPQVVASMAGITMKHLEHYIHISYNTKVKALERGANPFAGPYAEETRRNENESLHLLPARTPALPRGRGEADPLVARLLEEPLG